MSEPSSSSSPSSSSLFAHSGPCTEQAFFFLSPTSRVEDASTPDGRIWAESISTLCAVDGVRTLCYGRRVELRRSVLLQIGWETIEHRDRFRARASFPEFERRLQSLSVIATPYRNHVYFSDSGWALAAALRAPVTEYFTAYLAVDDLGEEHLGRYKAALGKKMDEAVRVGVPGIGTAVQGWAMEDQHNVALGSKRGKALLNLVGWDSVEAHRDFTRTEWFRENIVAIKDWGASAVEVWHSVNVWVKG